MLVKAKHLDLAPRLLAFPIVYIWYHPAYSTSLVVCVVHEIFLMNLILLQHLIIFIWFMAARPHEQLGAIFCIFVTWHAASSTITSNRITETKVGGHEGRWLCFLYGDRLTFDCLHGLGRNYWRWHRHSLLMLLLRLRDWWWLLLLLRLCTRRLYWEEIILLYHLLFLGW